MMCLSEKQKKKKKKWGLGPTCDHGLVCTTSFYISLGKTKNMIFPDSFCGGKKRLSILIEANHEKNLTDHICAVILTGNMILLSIPEKYVILGNP